MTGPTWFSPSDYFHRLLAPLGEVTTAMERFGVPFDVPAARDLLERVRDDEAGTRGRLHDWLGPGGVDYVGPEMPPNLGSWIQLQYLLYTPLGCNMRPSPYWKKGSTGYDESGREIVEGEGECKTDDVALRWLAGEYPEHAAGLQLIRDVRWQSRVANYISGWLNCTVRHTVGCEVGTPEWDWLHPSFGLASDRDERAGAKTGRFAVKGTGAGPLNGVPSSGDNYLIRTLFSAPEGWSWVVADQKQLEIVELAHLCNALFGTDALCRRVEPGAPDMHSATAKFVWGETLGNETLRAMPVEEVKARAPVERDATKIVRYSLNYGRMKFGDILFDRTGRALGAEGSDRFVQALYEFDPEIPMYHDWVRDFITRNLGMPSLMGRWCPLPDAASDRRGLRNRAWRQALNWPLQAGGQEIIAAVLLAVQHDPIMRRLRARPMLPVHDEICVLAPTPNAEEALDRLMHLMTNTVRLRATLSASGGTGQSWGEAK